MAFSLHDFIMKGLRDAVGHLADYAVILNAVGWMEKGVLTEADLAELQTLIDEKNAPEPESEPELEPEPEPAEA